MAQVWRRWSAIVLDVTDGDTIKVDIALGKSAYGLEDADLGFYVHTRGRRLYLRTAVRLNGLNANEHGTIAGETAKVYVQGLLRVDQVVRLDTIKVPYGDKREKYGRFLGVFWPLGVDRSLNEMLVDSGHALPWDGKGLRPV
jgi:endonuclease YncB( thermonuclease family)